MAQNFIGPKMIPTKQRLAKMIKGAALVRAIGQAKINVFAAAMDRCKCRTFT
jgi:hypothetical protein